MYAKFIIIQPERPLSMDSSPMADEEGVWCAVLVAVVGLGLGDRLINLEYGIANIPHSRLILVHL